MGKNLNLSPNGAAKRERITVITIHPDRDVDVCVQNFRAIHPVAVKTFHFRHFTFKVALEEKVRLRQSDCGPASGERTFDQMFSAELLRYNM